MFCCCNFAFNCLLTAPLLPQVHNIIYANAWSVAFEVIKTPDFYCWNAVLCAETKAFRLSNLKYKVCSS